MNIPTPPDDKNEPILPPLPEQVRADSVPLPQPSLPASDKKQVYVAPDLERMASAAVDEHDWQEKRDLEAIIHRLLVAGVALSVALMLTGLALDVILQRAVPESVAPLNEVIPRVLALRPSGFLALGLLVLIATPILRVFASIFAFVYERDWRYALITLVVFLIVLASIFLGKG